MPDGAEIEMVDLPEPHLEEQPDSRDSVEVVAETAAPPETNDNAGQDTADLQQDAQHDETGADLSSAASTDTTAADGVKERSKPALTALRVLLGLAAFILAVFTADWAGWTSAQAFRSDCWEQQVSIIPNYVKALLRRTIVCASEARSRMHIGSGAGAAGTTTATLVSRRSRTFAPSDPSNTRSVREGSDEPLTKLMYWLGL